MVDVTSVDTKTLIKRVVETTRCSASQAELALLENDSNVFAAVDQILEQDPAYECWTELKSRKKKEEEKLARGRGRGAFVRGGRGRGGSSNPQFRGGLTRGGTTRGHYEQNTNVMPPVKPKSKEDAVKSNPNLNEKKEMPSEIPKENIRPEVVKAATPSQILSSSTSRTNPIASPNRAGPISFAEAVMAGRKKTPSPLKVQPQAVETIKPPQEEIEKVPESAPVEVADEVVSKDQNATDTLETMEPEIETFETIATPPHQVEQVDEQPLEAKSPQIQANETWTSQLRNDLGIVSEPIEEEPPQEETPQSNIESDLGAVEFLYDPGPITAEFSFGYVEPSQIPSDHSFSCGDSQIVDPGNSVEEVVEGDAALNYEQMCRAAQTYQLQQYIGNNYNVARGVQPPLGFAQNIYGIQTQGHPGSYDTSNYNPYMIPQQGGVRGSNSQEYVGGHYAEQIVQPPPGFANCYIQAQGNTVTRVPQYDFSQYSMQQNGGNVGAIQVHQLYSQVEENKTTSGAKPPNRSQEFVGTHFANANPPKKTFQYEWKN